MNSKALATGTVCWVHDPTKPFDPKFLAVLTVKEGSHGQERVWLSKQHPFTGEDVDAVDERLLDVEDVLIAPAEHGVAVTA